MQSLGATVEEYCAQVPQHQAEAFHALRKTICDHLPAWFVECINYGMLGYVVPKTIYPAGYHCDPSLPLPFLWLAYQKNSINIYHMWLYADPVLLEWFVTQWPHYCTKKLDMGKSCIRCKWYDAIPYPLFGELVEKMSVTQWIALYETAIKK